MTSEEAIAKVAASLGERDEKPLGQIGALAGVLGHEELLRVLAETDRLEAEGGMPRADGKGRRSKGGVFFALARKHLNREQKLEIFGTPPPQEGAPKKPKPEVVVAPKPAPRTVVSVGGGAAPSRQAELGWSDEDVRSSAVAYVVEQLSRSFALRLRQERVPLNEDEWCTIDAAHLQNPVVLVQVYLDSGRPAEARRHAVMSDVLKLSTLKKARYPQAICAMAFVDDKFAKEVQFGWRRIAFINHAVKVHVVALPESLRGASEPARRARGRRR